MEQEQGVSKEYLGKVSAARYEAQTFMSMHPEYFVTPANGKLIGDYMLEHNLILTAENFEHTFEKLKSQGKLLPPREALATMNADEIKQFTRSHGVPVRDGFGNVSYELPEIYMTAPSEDYNRPRQSRYTESRLPTHPEDARRDPSKREWAFWSSDRQRDWLIARGYWGGDLPDFLR
jgi:hypothetical protein